MTDTDGVDAILDQWHRERPDLEPSPIGVIGRISRLARQIERRLEPVYAASGLEPGWYDVLATLRRAGPPYQLRPTDFAATLMLTTSGTTKRLDRLEAAGHITRAPDPGDRRGVLITLTPQGRNLIDAAAAPKHLANERRILSGLTAAEQDQLAGLLRKLSLTLPPQEKDEPPPAPANQVPAADDSRQNTRPPMGNCGRIPGSRCARAPGHRRVGAGCRAGG